MQTLQDGSLFANVGFWVNVSIVVITSFAAFVIKQLKFSDRQQWKAIDELREKISTLRGEHDASVHRRK